MPYEELPEHGHDFLASLGAERGLSTNTTQAYRRDLIQYRTTIDECGGALDTRTIHLHLERLRTRELSQASIARKLASIRTYHRFLVAEGYRSDDPTAAIGSPGRMRSLPKALTVDEVLTLLEHPDRTTPLGVRDAAVLEFLYATGCRVTELTTIDLHDVDSEIRSALVTGKGNKQRMVPLGSYAVAALERWLPIRLDLRRSGSDSGALFLTARGNRLTRQSVWRIVRNHGTGAGIASEHLSPHVLRHSAATHMVEGGADLRTVQEMLGHASLSTTQLYTKVSPEHLREILITSHPRGH